MPAVRVKVRVMGVRRGRLGPPLDFKILAKKGCFLSFQGEKLISPLLAPLQEFWKNPLVALPGNNSSDAHGRSLGGSLATAKILCQKFVTNCTNMCHDVYLASGNPAFTCRGGGNHA